MGMMWIEPPPQYDHAPPMAVIEHVMSAAEVDRLCIGLMHGTGNGQPWSGCGRIAADGKCYILHIGTPQVRRHERAHCAGWPAGHPGGVWQEVKGR